MHVSKNFLTFYVFNHYLLVRISDICNKANTSYSLKKNIATHYDKNML